MEAQADLQSVIGRQRLYEGSSNSPSASQDINALERSLARLHGVLGAMGKPMYDPATHPDVSRSPSNTTRTEEPMKSADQVIVFEVEIPAIYTADLDGLREWQHDMTESEFLLNCIGEPGVCRLRSEISGDKDSTIEEVWGHVRAARLDTPSPGITDKWLAEQGWKLVPEDDGWDDDGDE